MAIENARLYEEQRRIATTLQENLLHPLPEVAGLEVATTSAAASDVELIGGDFSDVFMLADGRALIVIGDVAGKGIRAAGLTETVRSTMRAFATIDAAPAFILRKTNELLLWQNDPNAPHVTALVCVVDPGTGHINLGSAGHPPPVHLSPFSCELPEIPFGPPLGAFPADYQPAHLTLTPDDYLVLYTDGVTEARGESELFGEDRLVEAVQHLRGSSAEGMAQGIAEAALGFGGKLRDDLQVVVARLG